MSVGFAVCVSMCHIAALNKTKEKKYKGVLEIKYKLSEYLIETSKTTYWGF